MGILFPILLIVFCCIIIWRAGDGFMISSEYIGRNLSDGVRGATINAMASSMPELFTSLFFLFILKDAEGFSGGIGTTAGSAIFNSMVIPAASVLTVLFMGLTRKVTVSRKVMWRDGISLLVAELIFIILISGNSLHWYHGLILMIVYFLYLTIMFGTMSIQEFDETESTAVESTDTYSSFYWSLLTFDLEGIFIGSRRLNSIRAWSLLVFSTTCIALVCYFLVLACQWVGSEQYTIPYIGTFSGLGIPVMFVALILASAASSFPDTIISIKDAKNGKYDDAISNALGSNIFDICFALGFPLFLFTLIYGPISMPDEVVRLSSELRFLLWILTAVVLIIFVWGPYIGKFKSSLLIALYGGFIGYVVSRGAEYHWSQMIADWLVGAVSYLNFF